MAALESSPRVAPDSPEERQETREEKLARELMNVRRDRGRAKKSVFDTAFEDEVIKVSLESPTPIKQSYDSNIQTVVFSPKGEAVVISIPKSPLEGKNRVAPKGFRLSDPNSFTTINRTLHKIGEDTAAVYEDYTQMLTPSKSQQTTEPMTEMQQQHERMPYQTTQVFSLHGEDLLLNSDSKDPIRQNAIDSYKKRLEQFKQEFGKVGFDYDNVGVTIPTDFRVDAVVAAETDSVYIGTINDPLEYMKCMQEILTSRDTMAHAAEAEDLILRLMQNIQILNKAKRLKRCLDVATEMKQPKLNVPDTYIDKAGCTIFKKLIRIPHRRMYCESPEEMNAKGRPLITAGIVTAYADPRLEIPPIIFSEKKGKGNTFFWIDALMDLYTRKIRKQLSIVLTCGDIQGNTEHDVQMTATQITSFLTTSAVMIRPSGINFSTIGVGKSSEELKAESKARKAAVEAAIEAQEDAAAKQQLLDFLKGEKANFTLTPKDDASEIIMEFPSIEDELRETIQELKIPDLESKIDEILKEEKKLEDSAKKTLEFDDEHSGADPLSGTSGKAAAEGGTRRKRQTKRKRKTKKTKTRKRTRKSFGKTRK